MDEAMGKAKELVWDYVVSLYSVNDIRPSGFDVYVVWACYILGGWKMLLSTSIEDGRYYEVTYDKIREAIYLDAYIKESNEEIYVGE